MREKVDLLNGSVHKQLLKLAWPVILGMFMGTLYNLVDTIWLGRLNAYAVAAVSVVFPVFFIFIAIGNGVGIGATSFIARYIGAKRPGDARKVAHQSILIILFVSVIVTIFCTIFAKSIFTGLGATDDILPYVLDYGRVIFITSSFLFLTFVATGILRGEGDTITPMKIMAATTIFNIILDPFLIFGIGPFPRMEVFGAAVATAISGLLNCVLLFRYLLSGKGFFKLELKKLRPDFPLIRKIIGVGLPATISQIMVSGGMMLLMRNVAYFGTFALAAYGIGIRMNGVVVLPAVGMMSAVMAIVGQNVGAKNLHRAEKTTWTALSFVTLFMSIMALLFFFFPRFWVMIFTSDIRVVEIGHWYFRIIAVSYLFRGMMLILGGAQQGAGDAVTPLVITGIAWFGIAAPLAHHLSITRALGITGVWWGMLAAIIFSGLANIVMFKIGRWKKAEFKL
ncbi:MATE family efflux transporter [Candidatus Woesearchaeota archaeon CG11_big_fil_rev_8_21_14_0_20_43_8]|nr:MAG: MATE family efflux transporter [Candidatus Woesearchaeota archaeon CG11_big_fil_rev_8_21_14_0_20_43_8]PIO06678.1 MAG: MATE family efflux transporter [Candidatus Woesearchaeota archaeon CG08_land_8_20_14_0_20_43_7]